MIDEMKPLVGAGARLQPFFFISRKDKKRPTVHLYVRFNP